MRWLRRLPPWAVGRWQIGALRCGRVLTERRCFVAFLVKKCSKADTRILLSPGSIRRSTRIAARVGNRARAGAQDEKVPASLEWVEV